MKFDYHLFVNTLIITILIYMMIVLFNSCQHNKLIVTFNLYVVLYCTPAKKITIHKEIPACISVQGSSGNGHTTCSDETEGQLSHFDCCHMQGTLHTS